MNDFLNAANILGWETVADFQDFQTSNAAGVSSAPASMGKY
jgi:hypothetical protein